MKKHIANIITGSRIVFSLSLLFIPLSSAWFYALYLLCGFSDMIDGTVARRTNSASEFGARLDTLSDFVFLSVALIKFVPNFHIPVWLGYGCPDQAWKRGLGIYSHEKIRIPSYSSE